MPLLAVALWHVDPALPLEQMHGGAADMTSSIPALCNICNLCTLYILDHTGTAYVCLHMFHEFFSSPSKVGSIESTTIHHSLMNIFFWQLWQNVNRCDKMWEKYRHVYMNIIPIIQGDSQTDVSQCLTARRFQEDSRSWRRWSQSAGEEEAWALNKKEHKHGSGCTIHHDDHHNAKGHE